MLALEVGRLSRSTFLRFHLWHWLKHLSIVDAAREGGLAILTSTSQNHIDRAMGGLFDKIDATQPHLLPSDVPRHWQPDQVE